MAEICERGSAGLKGQRPWCETTNTLPLRESLPRCDAVFSKCRGTPKTHYFYLGVRSWIRAAVCVLGYITTLK